LPIDPKEFQKKLGEVQRGVGGQPAGPASGSGFGDQPVGTSLYQVKPGESWSYISSRVYGTERMTQTLMKANPNHVGALQPGQIIVLPDRNPRAILETEGPVDFWADRDTFNDEINRLDLDFDSVVNARNAEQLTPEFNDRIYLGFDANDQAFMTKDNTGLPLYYHPNNQDQPYSPEISGIPARWGMMEAFPYVQRRAEDVEPADRKFFDDRTELEKVMESMAQIEDFRLNEPVLFNAHQKYVSEIDSIVVAQPAGSIIVTGPTGEEIHVPTEASFQRDGRTSAAEIELHGDTVRWIDEPVMALTGATFEHSSVPDSIQRAAMNIVGLIGSGILMAWSAFKEVLPGDSKPVPINPVTGKRLTPTEKDRLEAQGIEIAYQNQPDYHAQNFLHHVNALDSIIDPSNDITTITFWQARGVTNPELYAAESVKLGSILKGYTAEQIAYLVEVPKEQQVPMVGGAVETIVGDYFIEKYDIDDSIDDFISFSEWRSERLLEFAAEAEQLANAANHWLQQGDSTTAINLMRAAQQKRIDAAYGVSPYYSYSWTVEPWRKEAFLNAAAEYELQLWAREERIPTNREIRLLRDRFVNIGTEILFQSIADPTPILAFAIKPISIGIGKLDDLFRLSARAGSLWTKAAEVRSARGFVNPIALVDWLKGDSVRAAGSKLKNMANDVALQAARAADSSFPVLATGSARSAREIIEALGRAAMGSTEKLPSTISLGRVEQVMRLGRMSDNATLGSVMRIHPENWGELWDEAVSVVYEKEYLRLMDDLKRQYGDTIPNSELGRISNLATERSNKPRLVAEQWGRNFQTAHNAIHASSIDPRFMEDQMIVRIAEFWGYVPQDGAKLVAIADFLGSMRNRLYQFWLSLRPGWTWINYTDSIFRYLVMGGHVLDDFGGLWRANWERLLESEMVKTDLLETLQKAISIADPEDILRPTVIERALRGDKTGIPSLVVDAAKQRLREVFSPNYKHGAFHKWIVGVGGTPFAALSGGLFDANALMEASLRVRLSLNYYFDAFDNLMATKLDDVLKRMADSGIDENSLARLQSAIAQSYDNGAMLEDFMQVLAGKRPVGDRIASYAVVPHEFVKMMEEHGVPRSMRSVLFNDFVKDLQEGMNYLGRNASIDDQVKFIDDFFIRSKLEIDDLVTNRLRDERLNQMHASGDFADIFGPAPARDAVESPPPPKIIEEMAGSGIEEDIINAAPGLDDQHAIRITRSELHIQGNDYYYFSPEFNESGRAFGQSRRELQNTVREFQGIEKALEIPEERTFMQDQISVLQRADEMHTNSQARLANWGLHYFPHPTAWPAGRMRREAWLIYERMRVKAYDASSEAMRALVESVKTAESAADLRVLEETTLREVLESFGVQSVANPRGRGYNGVRYTEDLIGDLSGFATASSRIQPGQELLNSFFGPGISISRWDELMDAPYNSDTIAKALDYVDDVAETLPRRIGDDVVDVGYAEVRDQILGGIRGANTPQLLDQWGDTWGFSRRKAQLLRQLEASGASDWEIDNFILRTAGERLSDVEAEELVRVLADAQSDAGAYWQAFINQPRQEGRSLAQQWGRATVATPESFMAAIDSRISELDDLGDNAFPMLRLKAEASSIESHRIKRFENLMGEAQLPYQRSSTYPIQPPYWEMTDEFAAWTSAQQSLSSTRHSLLNFMDAWNRDLRERVLDGRWSPNPLPRGQRELIEQFQDELTSAVSTASDIAMDGTGMLYSGLDDVGRTDVENWVGRSFGRNQYKGAARLTQDAMLDYGNVSRFDNLMKGVIPFWMFPSRSMPFWLKTAAANPELVAWYFRYERASRKNAMDIGAVTRDGHPLSRFAGYLRIPGSDIWVSPVAPVSFRYIFPRRMPDPDEFAPTERGVLQTAASYIYEYGRMFGIGFAPWITIPAYGIGALENSYQPKSQLISQPSLIPPWWTADLRRKLRQTAPVIHDTLFQPDVGWIDYLIEQRMYQIALQKAQNDTSHSPATHFAAVQEALGYKPVYNEQGELVDWSYSPSRDHELWQQARAAVEKDQWISQVSGYWTSVYPKRFTDAEAEMLRIRDSINTYRDTMNNMAGTVLFGLDQDPERRVEIFNEMRFDTPEGYAWSLYNSSGWVQTPEGELAPPDQRGYYLAQSVYQRNVTEAYWDARAAAYDQYLLKPRRIGEDPAIRRSDYAAYARAIHAIETNPMYAAAHTEWTYGYRTDEQIVERLEDMLIRRILDTKPHWFQDDEEPYGAWEARVLEWEQEIPIIARTMADIFVEEEVKAHGIDETDPFKIPGGRRLIPWKLMQDLVGEMSIERITEWSLENDQPMDAMNGAWRAIVWEPYMQLIQELEGLDSNERDRVERQYLESHNEQPTLDQLAKWVFDTYGPDRFTMEELEETFNVAGGSVALEERILPKSRSSQLHAAAWELLGWIGPGDNFKQLKQEFVRLGGDASDFDVFYETQGQWFYMDDREVYESAQSFMSLLQTAAENMGVQRPSEEHLIEWSLAKQKNDEFRRGVEDSFTNEIWTTLGYYGFLSGKERSVFKKDHPELDDYFEMKDFFAEENQVWAKYYHISRYLGGAGIPGQGAEGRSDFKPYGGKSGGGSRKTSFSAGGGGVSRRDTPFIPQGYRSTYTVRELFDPKRLGSGGVGGSPYWPTGWGSSVPQPLLQEVIKKYEDNKPLSEGAKTYLSGSVSKYSNVGVGMYGTFEQYKEWVMSLLDDVKEPIPPPKGGGRSKIT